MKTTLKQLMSYLAVLFVSALLRIRLARYFLDLVNTTSQNNKLLIKHEDIDLNFYVPNTLSRYRASTFSTKEPETLKWIDEFEEGANLWDIGANIGLYSCYAASKKGSHVVAFEPSVFNLELLCKNIYINKLDNLVRIFPLALSDGEGFGKFYLSNIIQGGALSTFGEPLGHDGNELKPIFQYSIYGISLDFAVYSLGLDPPDYLKIDVDGIEHLILKGATRLLKEVKSILVEINDQFIEQSELTRSILVSNNFEMIAKLHSETVENSKDFNAVFNQIWINKNYK
ncbi:FkbM family methyltransferase [Polynucleobacter bastaniensis]|uniref:FkbM family methyltransferase n=1 Tax=Polynucleobacter bastaniensis TaxID=2081039 RepID=UPI001C0E636B|nr:FkbM family methyltransferase [Polynucleobacter bastaniensis]MBU3598268.1 FkbM family methyltransferase [Polynucleobacter bastaniensis]